MNALAATFPDAGEVVFRGRCSGDDDAVGRLVEELQATFSARLVDPERAGNVLIVLGEMLNNTVEHAMRGRSDGWIDLTVRSFADRMEVLTRDDGRALPPALLEGGRDLPAMGDTPDDMPEGGFGWFLIHTLVDDLTYERTDGVNRMTFSF